MLPDNTLRKLNIVVVIHAHDHHKRTQRIADTRLTSLLLLPEHAQYSASRGRFWHVKGRAASPWRGLDSLRLHDRPPPVHRDGWNRQRGRNRVLTHIVPSARKVHSGVGTLHIGTGGVPRCRPRTKKPGRMDRAGFAAAGYLSLGLARGTCRHLNGFLHDRLAHFTGSVAVRLASRGHSCPHWRQCQYSAVRLTR